jgi:outer membrane immunogenic protein
VIALSSIPAKADPSWSGAYVGGHGGYGWADWDGTLFSTTHAAAPDYAFANPNQTLSDEGWLGGAQIGFNHQTGQVVFGLEGDISAADISADGGPYVNKIGSHSWEVATEVSWLATLRGRVGIAHQDLLIYATGGLAYARTEGDLNVMHLSCPNLCPRFSADGHAEEDHFGYAVGGGLEWRLGGNWSLKSEYLYVDLGEEDYHMTGKVADYYGGAVHDTDSFPADLALHTVRVGINYKFGSRDAPVPLK